MASNVGVISRIWALLRTPYDLVIVLGIRFKVRLWSFLVSCGAFGLSEMV
jgi:hypothetical protein